MSTKRLLKPEEYTVAWLCALPLSEAVAAWTMLDEEHQDLPQIDNDDNCYTYGSIQGHNVVIACMPPGMPGKVSASRMVHSLPTSFPNLRIQLFVGIGGGMPHGSPINDATKDIHLGDVIVGWADETGAPAVVQYDLIRATGQIKERLSIMDKPNRRCLTALGKMLTARVKSREFFHSHLERFIKAGVKGFGHPGPEKDMLYQSDYGHIGSATCEACDSTRVLMRESREDPVFHQGTIASGDTVVKDAKLREEIRQQCYGAKCVEMEAAGIVDQTHCLVIRGIADYADSHKNQIWQPYAAATAAAFAREFLLTIQPSAVAKMDVVQIQMNDIAANEERLRVLKWLSPLAFGPRLTDMLDRRQEGTGTWLLESQLFTAWINGDVRTIWCPGMPGAGKTILASTIVEYLQKIFDDASVGIGWVYCIYNEVGQTARSFLATLLHQFCQQKGPLSPEISKSYQEHCRHDTPPTVHELLSLLQSQVQRFAKVYIVIDALDEFPDGLRDTFLAELKKLPSSVHLLVTSRPDSSIESNLPDPKRLDISAHDDDVRQHLAARIANNSLLKSHIAADASLEDTIISKVTEKAGGMFLLAELHIESLSSQDNLRDLRRALETLPEKLDDTYHQTMHRIQSQNNGQVKTANKILSWVIFAQRPITIEELRCALAVEPEDSCLDKEALRDRGYLLSVCSGLIVITEKTEIVRFIHYTTQEYFERACHPQFVSAQTYLATTCITYLSFSTFASGPSLVLSDKQSRNAHVPEVRRKQSEADARLMKQLKENSLLAYASVHWGVHVRNCRDQDLAIHAKVTGFLSRKAHVSCSIETTHHLQTHGRYTELRSPIGVSDLHVAADFGLEWLTEELLQQGASVDAQDSNGWTPLHKASAKGHIDIIKRLVEKGANPGSAKGSRRDPLWLAAVAGHELATRFLLNKQASLPDMTDMISVVVANGHVGILRVVLESLRGTRNRAFSVGVAIRQASASENETCVRLLLEEGQYLERNEIQFGLNEAAFLALVRNDTVIVQLLLEKGADLIAAVSEDGTPLHRVADLSNTTAARYLLDHGANIEAINADGDRPIHIAVDRSNFRTRPENMLKLLLDRGADVNIYGSKGESPLITVSRQGLADSVQQLLDRGAVPLAKDREFNRSAIEWAAIKGHPRVVQLLSTSKQPAETIQGLLALSKFYQALDLEASDGKQTEINNRLLEINSSLPENLKRLLLLHRPTRRGDKTVVRTFINMGADIEAFSGGGKTAMHIAAANDQTKIVRLLLDHGAIIDSKRVGRGKWQKVTPLYDAIAYGAYDTVQLLIERGAEIEQDYGGRGTPLMEAIWHQREAIVRLLLQKGADPNTETAYGFGHRPLHIAVACYNGDLSLIMLLITKDANLDAKNNNGATPLLLAVELARIDVVRLLLEHGADPTTVEETATPHRFVHEVDFDAAMQLVRDAKLRRVEDAQSKPPSGSIDKPQAAGMKRTYSKISG